MAVIETWFNQDLQKPVKTQYIDGSLFSNNGNGNRIGVVVTDNGEPVTISGTVSGYVVVSDGSTVPCTGAKSGNRASILIPPAAYVPGSAFISLFVTDGTTVTTLAALSTTVLQTRTGTQVDPGSVVTDWTQTINGAMQDVQTAAANLGGIVATPYASLTYPVPLGKYTYYDGGLYRCISPIASSETFTPAHWTAVKLGDDVSDLKSAVIHNFDIEKSADFVNIGNVTNLTDWQNGYIRDDGTVGSATKQCRTAFRTFTSAYIMTFTPKTGYEMNIAKYTSNTPDTFVGFIVKNLSDGSITLDVSSGYFCFVVHKLDNTAISPETLPADIVTYQMQTSAKSAEMSYYWLSGYVRLNDGERIVVANRIMTNGYIDDSVQRIKAKEGYYFRVHAYSNDVYVGTYNDKDAFAKTGSSKNLTEFDFSPYAYKYKITVLKSDDTNIEPRTGNTVLFETAFSPAVNVDADTTANMCLAGICTSLDDNRLPFHKGFLFHEFGEGIRKLYYGSAFDKMKYIPVNTLADVNNRNFAISPKDGTIIFFVISGGVGRVRVLQNGKTYNTAYVQMPWLYNSGVDFIKDGNGDEYCIFAEYGANPGGAMKVYRGKYPYTSESNWETVLSVTGETDIHHFHQVRRDPWTNILYLTSGDENNLTHWWYSTDYGATWTVLVDGSDVVDTWGTMACRTINFIFTKDYIYWATDSYKNHMLCRIQRDAETGIIDLSTFEKLATLKEGCATNSLCYSEAPHGLFMYERVDSGATEYYGTPVTMQFYSLDTNTLEDVVTLGLTEDTWGGSRGKCYINYTNPNQPYPAMGFDGQTPCIFDLVYDDPEKIGTIVYDVKGKTVRDVLL